MQANLSLWSTDFRRWKPKENSVVSDLGGTAGVGNAVESDLYQYP